LNKFDQTLSAQGKNRRPIRLRLRNEQDHPVHMDNLVSTIPLEAWSKATIKEGSKVPV
jgi:hypothetical protein